MENENLSEESKKAQRRWTSEQSLASARIEGFVPTAEFLADCDAYVEGTMTTEEAGARCEARALAKKAADEVAKADRRWASDQALASSRIEGHVPSTEFLADCEAVVEGTMTNDEARARSLARALAADKAATERKLSASQAKTKG